MTRDESAVAAFQEFVAAVRPRIESELDRRLPAEHDPPRRLHGAMRYAVFAGGKRLRPLLLVLSGRAFGVDEAPLLGAAAAVEMIHTYSLVHDDLPALDDDDLRRGAPTVHRRYDEATAILTGDALLTAGLELLARAPESADRGLRADALALVAAAIGTRGMIGGQADDLEAEGQWPADPGAALESIHRRKTGALLEACVALGGLYAGLEAATMGPLRALGRSVGLLFQIADDILDVDGTAEALGKTPGKDARRRKLAYPGLFGIEESRRRLADCAAEATEIVRGLPIPDQPARQEFLGLVAYLAARRA
jgi:geranylgeranyl pyrophosphate synthase